MALNLGFEFGQAWVTIIPTGGATKEKRHYQLWAEIAGHAPLPQFALLDKRDEGEKQKLINAGMQEENILVLQKGDIEDYYPRPLIVGFVWNETEKEISEDNIPVGQTVESLRNHLPGGGKDRWKIPLARWMGEQITLDQIDGELRDFIKRVYSEAKTYFI